MFVKLLIILLIVIVNYLSCGVIIHNVTGSFDTQSVVAYVIFYGSIIMLTSLTIILSLIRKDK